MLHRGGLVLGIFLIFASCVRRVPVPAPPLNVRPDWGHVTKTSDCMVNGALQDPACTPGNINPALTKDVICGPDFHTSDYRDQQSRPTQKAASPCTRFLGHPAAPEPVSVRTDHLIPLELGGADDLSNIWPECSPGYA